MKYVMKYVMKFSFVLAFLCAALAVSAQVPYRVIAPIPDVADGEWAYMTDDDLGVVVDSALVKDHKAVFTGDVDEPYLVVITSGGRNYGLLVLEQGTCTINQATGIGVGTMLNDCLKALFDEVAAVTADPNVDQDTAASRIIEIERRAIEENRDTPVAYAAFVDLASYITADEIRAILNANPELAEYERVKMIIADIDDNDTGDGE